MDNPPDLQGASRTTGGIFRGRALGNVFNVGDCKDDLESNIGSMVGKVKVFMAGEDPSTKKPQMTLKVKVGGDLAPVLDAVAKRFSPVKSE
jgi:hypothetical protein